MSWMWIFILDGGLHLAVCLFVELLAPVLLQGTEILPGLGEAAGKCWSHSSKRKGREGGNAELSMAG